MNGQSTSDMEKIKKSSLDLEIAKIKVIPIAIGDAVNKEELIAITPHKGNLIEPDSKDPSNKTAEKIINKAIEGTSRKVIYVWI